MNADERGWDKIAAHESQESPRMKCMNLIREDS